MIVVLSAAVAVLSTWLLMGWFRRSDYAPRGKHCYITGGSSGLGKALAESLVKQGAHVSIVARDVAKGERVVQELKAFGHPTQHIRFIPADLTDPDVAKQALDQACAPFDDAAPDYIFLCAGFARPKLLVDATVEDMQAVGATIRVKADDQGFNGVFWVSAYTAQLAAQRMIRQRRRGKITFVSSFLGYTSFAGYSTYSPGKYALRGMADALRSEMLLHDISVHIFMPCGIAGPGLDAENAHKPRVTQTIEQGDTPIAPEASAAWLEKGLRAGHYQITDNLVADFVRLRSNGGVPGNNTLLDAFYLLVSTIGVPIWRMTADATVKKARSSVEADLDQRGHYQ